MEGRRNTRWPDKEDSRSCQKNTSQVKVEEEEECSGHSEGKINSPSPLVNNSTGQVRHHNS